MTNYDPRITAIEATMTAMEGEGSATVEARKALYDSLQALSFEMPAKLLELFTRANSIPVTGPAGYIPAA